MKKITKFITALGTSAAAATIIPLAVTSCNKSQSTVEYGVDGVVTENVFTGNEGSVNLYFTLKQPLAEDQKLSIEVSNNEAGLFDFEVSSYKQLATVTVSRTTIGSLLEECMWYGDITFTCKKGDDVVWMGVVEDCYVGYAQMISVENTEIATDPDVKTKNIRVNLYEGLSYTEYVDVNLVNLESNVKVTLGTVTPNLDKSYIDVEVVMPNTVVLNDTAIFRIDVLGRDTYGEQLWHETTAPITLTYNANVITIPTTEITIDDSGKLTTVTTTFDTSKNYILDLTQLPANKTVTSVAANFYASISDTNKTQIKTLKLNKECLDIGEAAFKDSQITKIDLSAMDIDLSTFARGKFGTNSFAVTPTTGKITYPSTWYDVQRHRINKELMLAGLTSTTWYDAIVAKNLTELRYALQYGANVKMSGDVAAADRIITVEDEINIRKTAIIDLNGWTIKADKSIYHEEKEQTGILAVWDDAQLLLVDTDTNQKGSIITPDVVHTESSKFREYETFCITVKNSNYYKYEQPVVEVRGGNFYGSRSCIYNDGGIVHIDGGNFHLNLESVKYWQSVSSATTANGGGARYMLNCHDEAYTSHNTKFIVYKGDFYGWTNNNAGAKVVKNFYNPAEVHSEPTTASSISWVDSESQCVEQTVGTPVTKDSWIENFYFSVTYK